MTEREKVELKKMNEILEGALRKMFLKGIGSDYPTGESNELLGQRLRARLEAQEMIEEGFKEIERLNKKDEPQKIKENEAV